MRVCGDCGQEKRPEAFDIGHGLDSNICRECMIKILLAELKRLSEINKAYERGGRKND